MGKSRKIQPFDLNGKDFIVREKGSGTRELFETLMAVNEITWNPIWICNNTEAIKNAVASGMGISVISRMTVQKEVDSGQLFVVEIDGIHFERKFNIVYHKNKFISDVMESFINTCRIKYNF